MSDGSISKRSHQTENETIDQDDIWTDECLEYLFNNKIWLPDFVRSEQTASETNIFNFKLQQRYLILIPLLLPVIDILTDYIFAILNTNQTNSPAAAALGFALLMNIIFGPMLYGQRIIVEKFEKYSS